MWIRYVLSNPAHMATMLHGSDKFSLENSLLWEQGVVPFHVI